MFIILQNYAKFSSNYTTSMSIQLNGNYSILHCSFWAPDLPTHRNELWQAS